MFAGIHIIDIFRRLSVTEKEGTLQPSVYYNTGLVTDYKYSYEVSRAFRRQQKLSELVNLSKRSRLWKKYKFKTRT